MLRRLRLRTYLFLGLVLWAGVGAAGVVVTVGRGEEVAIETSREGSIAAAAALARNVELNYGYARQLVVAGARRPGLIRFVQEEDLERVQRVLDVIYQDTPYFRSTYALYPDLRPLRGAPGIPDELPVPVALRRVVETLQPWTSEALRAPDGSRYVVVAEPIISGSGVVVGLLVGEISFTRVAADLSGVRFGESGGAGLVDSEGAALDGRAGGGRDAALAEHLSPTVQERWFVYRNVQGTSMAAAVVPVSGTRWFVRVAQPESEFNEASRSLSLSVWAVLGLSLLGTLGLGALIIRAINAPIARMVEAAQAVSGGDYTRKMPSAGIWEISVLGESVDRMAEGFLDLLGTVERQNHDLELRIVERTKLLQERTEELAATNAELVDQIHQREQMEVQLESGQKMELIGRLTASIGHEINNPLMFLTQNLERLAETSDSVPGAGANECHECLDDALLGAERIREIVTGMQQLASSGSGERELVRVDDAVRLAVSMTRNRIRHRAELVVDIQDDLRVWGSQAQLEQVVVNLLVNGSQACEEGSPDSNQVSVRVARTEHGMASIVVEDTGTGMDQETLERVFVPFYSTKMGRGVGLGLAVSRRLTQAMGGTLDVTSELGSGSCFRLLLPLASDESIALQAGRSSAVDAPRRSGARILVIDDEPALRRSLRRMLRQHDVRMASSAASAMDLLCDHDFDMILCDVMMPEENGLEFYARVCADHPELAHKFILMSGGIFPDVASKVVAAGPLVLAKPFEARDVDALLPS